MKSGLKLDYIHAYISCMKQCKSTINDKHGDAAKL